MEERLYRGLAHPLVRVGVGALALVYLGVLALVLLPPILRLAGPPLDLGFFGYPPTRVAAFLAALGEGGRSLYRLFLLADLGFAPLYGLALTGWLYHLYRRPNYARWPLVAAMADWAENLLLLANLGSFNPTAATLAGYLTFFKWLLLAYSLLALFLGLFWWRRG